MSKKRKFWLWFLVGLGIGFCISGAAVVGVPMIIVGAIYLDKGRRENEQSN